MVNYSAFHWSEKARKSAEEAQRIKDSLGNVYVFKGSVATLKDLPTNASVGDVYDVLDTGKNYAWDGSRWDDIGGTVDLSAYAKTSYVDGREQAIREDYMQADTDLQTQITGQSTAITKAQGDIVELQSNKQDVISDLDTIRFGAGKGATAVQPSDLSAVATSGSYNDLTNKPTIPSATSQLTNDSDYTTKNYVDTTEQEIIENYMQADTDLQTQITGLSTALTTAQGNITTINGKIPTSASSSNQLITNTELTNATQSVRSDFADADSEIQTQITGLSGTVATNQKDIVNLKAQKYGADLSYADNQLQLLDQDGNAIGTAVEIISGGSSNDKLDIDLGNATDTTKETIVGWGMPSDNYVDYSYTNEANYIAPANGYFYLRGTGGSSGSYVGMCLGNSATSGSYLTYKSNSAGTLTTVAPVSNGQVVTPFRSGVNINTWRFYYAKGEI